MKNSKSRKCLLKIDIITMTDVNKNKYVTDNGFLSVKFSDDYAQEFLLLDAHGIEGVTD